jgi:3-deoxy-D-manno-octulosonic-acid transferase
VTGALYTAALGTVVAGYAPFAVYRRLSAGVPLNLAARLGRLAPLPGRGPRGWVHAVSVGETLAAEPLVHGLARSHPGLPLVVTTVTETGAGVARDRFQGIAEHRFFPLDFPAPVRRAIAAIDPAFLVCMETELWPNLLRALAARGTPVMVANGRISDRSFRRYARVRRFLAPLLAGVRVFAMQSEEDARRIAALGAPAGRVVVTGNVKQEAPPAPGPTPDAWRALLGLAPGQPVWVAGSTHAGEEAPVLAAHREARARWPELALVLAPRHPERASEVAAVAARDGSPVVRRTALPAAGPHPLVVLDTVGELASLYAAADVVFVGGSLAPVGGHNVLEPARAGKPVLFGPHTTNFRAAAALLLEAGAARMVGDGAALAVELTRLLGDARLRASMGQAGREAVAARSGAVAATLELVERLLAGAAVPGP